MENYTITSNSSYMSSVFRKKTAEERIDIIRESRKKISEIAEERDKLLKNQSNSIGCK